MPIGNRGYGREGEGAEDAVEAPENVLVQRVVAETVTHRLDLGPDAESDQQPFEIVVRAGDLREFCNHRLGSGQEQRPDQSELGDQPPAPENREDGDGADRRARAAARCAVLLDCLRPAPPEEAAHHGSLSPISSP